MQHYAIFAAFPNSKIRGVESEAARLTNRGPPAAQEQPGRVLQSPHHGQLRSEPGKSGYP